MNVHTSLHNDRYELLHVLSLCNVASLVQDNEASLLCSLSGFPVFIGFLEKYLIE